MKIIALDYDESYTAFPELFNIIIAWCERNDTMCIMATMRYESEKDYVLEKLEQKIRVIYTNRQGKEKALNAMGIFPNLWIDDCPRFILGDAK